MLLLLLLSRWQKRGRKSNIFSFSNSGLISASFDAYLARKEGRKSCPAQQRAAAKKSGRIVKFPTTTNEHTLPYICIKYITRTISVRGGWEKKFPFCRKNEMGCDAAKCVLCCVWNRSVVRSDGVAKPGHIREKNSANAEKTGETKRKKEDLPYCFDDFDRKLKRFRVTLTTKIEVSWDLLNFFFTTGANCTNSNLTSLTKLQSLTSLTP